ALAAVPGKPDPELAARAFNDLTKALEKANPNAKRTLAAEDKDDASTLAKGIAVCANTFSEVPLQQVIDTLKSPFCVGAARMAVLNYLETRSGFDFQNDHFAAGRWGQASGLDVTSRPKYPKRVQ